DPPRRLGNYGLHLSIQRAGATRPIRLRRIRLNRTGIRCIAPADRRHGAAQGDRSRARFRRHWMADPAGGALEAADETLHSPHSESFFALALGSMGVVFGDIGTSPLYAMREALHHTRSTVDPQLAVLGVVSLVIWALILIVTIKYVVFLMRA